MESKGLHVRITVYAIQAAHGVKRADAPTLCFQEGNDTALPRMSCASLVNVISAAHTETGTEGAAGDFL